MGRGQRASHGRHQRGAGAQRGLDAPRHKSALPVQGRMGVTDHRQHRYAGRQRAQGHGLGKKARTRQDVRQRLPGDTEQRQQLIVPATGVQVVKLGTRSVGGVGSKGLAAAEFPQQPTVHGAQANLACGGTRVAIGQVVKQPAHLARRKHRIQGQAGLGQYPGLVALRTQLGAQGRRASALPAHAWAECGARVAAPGQHRFTLVADGQGIHRARDLSQALLDARPSGGPDRFRVLLGKPRLWVVEAQGPRGPRNYLAGLIDQHRLGVAGALIDRQNQRRAFAHAMALKPAATRRRQYRPRRCSARREWPRDRPLRRIHRRRCPGESAARPTRLQPILRRPRFRRRH